jgi:hypothetical protein
MIGHALGVEPRVDAPLFNKLLRPNSAGMEEGPMQLLTRLGVDAMRDHRERRERSQSAVRRCARQALRVRACDQAGLDEAMEFVARPDEKRTQL